LLKKNFDLGLRVKILFFEVQGNSLHWYFRKSLKGYDEEMLKKLIIGKSKPV